MYEYSVFACTSNPAMNYIFSTQITDGVSYKWLQGDKEIKDNKSSLKIKTNQVETTPIRCTVANKASNMTSDPVTQTCITTGECRCALLNDFDRALMHVMFCLQTVDFSSFPPEDFFSKEFYGVSVWIFVAGGGGTCVLLCRSLGLAHGYVFVFV